MLRGMHYPVHHADVPGSQCSRRKVCAFISYKPSEPLVQVLRSRMVNWKFSLAVVLSNIIVFIPLSLSLVLTYRRPTGGKCVFIFRRLTWQLIHSFRFSSPKADIRSQVHFDYITSLLLPFYSFLRTITIFHIQNLWNPCHYLAPHRHRNRHSWSPLWLWLNQ